jgi:hypothetical protein
MEGLGGYFFAFAGLRFKPYFLIWTSFFFTAIRTLNETFIACLI